MYNNIILTFVDSGIEQIQAAIGIQAGNVIRDGSGFLIGIVWAFAINWKLTLVTAVLLPIVSFLGFLNISVILNIVL